jgi:hypothetical protein
MVKPMALDGRERSFEKALARRVRANAAAAACPDAETLAAYHERSLTSEEMGAWKQHTAACANCQEILAQLEATDAIPVGADEGQEAAASAPLQRDPKHSRAVHWRWFAPAGALAAGLLVWVAVHEKQPAKVTQPAKIEIAENRAPMAPAPAATAPTVERGKAENPSSSSRAAAAADTRTAATDKLRNRRAELQGNEVATLSQGALAKSDRKDANTEVVAQAPQAATESVSVGDAADALKSKQPDELRMQGRQATNLAQLQPSPAKPATGGPAALPQAESKMMKKAPPEAAAAEALELSSGSREASAFRMAKSRSPQAVPAPGGKVIWRLGMAGLIEQSADGGVTWTPQTSGTTADLFLGSAPSEQVCWVIGNAGTILRTVDGGAHWISVASPISQDLYRIRASDALHATVWDASRRNSFQTDDGGVTWTQVSSQ